MSYHVRNPSRQVLRQQHQSLIDISKQQEQQQFRRRLQEPDEPEFQWTFFVNGGVNRVSNSDSSDLLADDNQNENDEYLSIVQKDEAAFTSLPNSNEPLVTYSSRAPNYPIGYSCEHTLFHTKEDDENSKGAVATINDALKLSYSNDEEENEAIVLNETDVSMSLEFQIPASVAGQYNKVISNVEALQWSILNQVAERSGLAKGCKLDAQHDHRALVATTAATNDMHRSFSTKSGSRNNARDPYKGKSVTTETSNIDRNSNRNHNKDTKYRRRARTFTTTDRSLVSSLPYPTSVYSIDSTRPNWTASCLSQRNESEQSDKKCFTAQINLDVKYRGDRGESDLIEEFIQSIVYNQIDLDSSQLFAEDLTGLKWITSEEFSSLIDESKFDQASKAPIFFGPEIDDDNILQGVDGSATPAPTDDPSDTLFASIMIPVGTAIFLIAVWCCAHRHYNQRRKSRRSAQKLKQKSITGLSDMKQLNDIETASDSTETTPEVASKNSSDSNCDSVENVSPAVSSSSSSSPSSSPLSKSKRSKKSLPISVDSPERSAAGLPPRPMVVKREISKQLKKQRKKKKRKKNKVMALQRINSRDRIDELPMISESESECDSESGGEDDEYFQNDDASSYDASAGCLTPSRRSRTSSRASSSGSPQQSPKDDSLLVESTIDYEFVMEAPEFSQDLFAQLKASDSNVYTKNNQEISPVPKLTLQPKLTVPKIDRADAQQETTREFVVSTTDERELKSMEIETESELDSSFSKEHGTVMERMMPLPWLASSRNPKIL